MNLAAPVTVEACSTPFGIKEFCTIRQIAAWLAASMCSTPFGIKEFCTSSTVSMRRFCSKCSTPFGIKEFCTANRHRRPAPVARVLNAFRHQRILHRLVVSLAAIQFTRAQRLSASKNSAHSPLRTVLRIISRAQRLSASKNSAPDCHSLRLLFAYGAQRLSASKNSAQCGSVGVWVG